MESSEILDPPTHMEIAIMLNVSRETVSRVFQSLQSQGIVRRAGTARLDVIKLKLLKELAEGSHKM
jgi:DNA-binding transcriptional regulator YhcF (GntR family)